MAGEGIATLLPIMIPASVISLILLLILLLSGVLKERQIRQSAVFLTENMGDPVYPRRSWHTGISGRPQGAGHSFPADHRCEYAHRLLHYRVVGSASDEAVQPKRRCSTMFEAMTSSPFSAWR